MKYLGLVIGCVACLGLSQLAFAQGFPSGQFATKSLAWDWFKGTVPGEDGVPLVYLVRCAVCPPAPALCLNQAAQPVNPITIEKTVTAPKVEILLRDLLPGPGRYACQVVTKNDTGEGPASAAFPFAALGGLPAAASNVRLK